MANKGEELFTNLDVSEAMRQWTRLYSDTLSRSINLGQPLLEAYLKNLSVAATNFGKAYRRGCEIPETECPPYCVCELEWEACEGDVVQGSIEIHNTGKQDCQFSLSADEFRSGHDLSTVKAKLEPEKFSLKAGEVRRVDVLVQLKDSMNPNQTYRTEIKISGRYEQCVRLIVHVLRKVHPNCKVEHGEIPTRIVAHNWYDHFQCEELCFEPVRPSVTTTVVKRVSASKSATGSKRTEAKRKSARKHTAKQS